MKIHELRQLTFKKLLVRLAEVRRELAVTRFHTKTGQNQNTAAIGKQRREVAQIKTLLHNEVK
jgi:ribosomal protein L29